MTRRIAAVADPTAGKDQEPKRFGVRDLRNDTAAVLAEAERSGAWHCLQVKAEAALGVLQCPHTISAAGPL